MAIPKIYEDLADYIFCERGPNIFEVTKNRFQRFTNFVNSQQVIDTLNSAEATYVVDKVGNTYSNTTFQEAVKNLGGK